MGLNPNFDLQPEVPPTISEVTIVSEAPRKPKEKETRIPECDC